MIFRASAAAFAKLRVLVVFERDGDAGEAEERPFDGRGDGAGVEHVDARVQPAVDAADDDVGPPRAELEEAELHAVGRTSFDGPTAPHAAVGLVFLAGNHGREKRHRMPDAALLDGRRDDASHRRSASVPSPRPAGPGRKFRRRSSVRSACGRAPPWLVPHRTGRRAEAGVSARSGYRSRRRDRPERLRIIPIAFEEEDHSRHLASVEVAA